MHARELLEELTNPHHNRSGQGNESHAVVVDEATSPSPLMGEAHQSAARSAAGYQTANLTCESLSLAKAGMLRDS